MTPVALVNLGVEDPALSPHENDDPEDDHDMREAQEPPRLEVDTYAMRHAPQNVTSLLSGGSLRVVPCPLELSSCGEDNSLDVCDVVSRHVDMIVVVVIVVVAVAVLFLSFDVAAAASVSMGPRSKLPWSFSLGPLFIYQRNSLGSLRLTGYDGWTWRSRCNNRSGEKRWFLVYI